MAEEALQSTSLKANFHRLTRLLMRGGVQLLRETLNSIHSPADLPLKLADPAIQAQLRGARLTQPERVCLYPSPGVYGKSNDFDITLIFKLFRTICSLTPPPGPRGWDDLPNGSDRTLVADLVRIKYYRNEIYGHRPTMEISDIDFILLWEEISEALLRIATNISPAKRDEWERSIDDLLSNPLTPDEERCIEELETWYMQDMDVKNELVKLREELRSQRPVVVVIQMDLAGYHQAALSEPKFPVPNLFSPEPEQAAVVDDPEPNYPPDIDVWNVILSFKESVDLFLRYLWCKLHLLVRNSEVGSWQITVECSSLQVLEGLWEDYRSGHLNSVAHVMLITPQVLKKLGRTGLKLKTFISEDQYEKGKKLLEASLEMSSVSWKGGESKGQEKKDFKKEEIHIPKDKVGLIFGKKGWKRMDIIARSGIQNLFIKEDLVYIRGTEEQRTRAKQIIEKVLRREDDQGSWTKLTFIPEDCMAKVIGKNRMNLKKIEAKTKATLKVFERNSFYIKGSPESQTLAIRAVKETVKTSKKKFVARFVHVDTAQLEEDREFKLSIAQPSPNTMMWQKCFKLELQDDPLKEETPSGFADTESLKEKVLGILKQIHQEKKEEMVIVDIWCHFGHAYLIKVDEDEEDDIFTLGEIKDRIESTDDDRWKTFFAEVETIEVEQIEKSLNAENRQSTTPTVQGTTSDDIRYDLTFFTPSCSEVRVKVWLIEKEPGTEGGTLAFRRSAPLPVRNSLTQILPDEHSGDASNSPIFHICDTFHQRMKLDILMPSVGFDCRLKIRTFPKFPHTTTPQAEEEHKILENYLMEMRIEDGQLKFPPISELPDGFDLFFQRRSLRTTYEYEDDGDMFTLTVCKDQSKEVNANQTDAYSFNESEAKPDVHLHCEEWDQLLNEGNWEPEQITAKLPKFLQFLRKVQGNL